MAESCDSCRFSAPGPDREPVTLECRRRPPVTRAHPIAGWPLVFPDSWCGEYEQKPVTAAKAAPKKRPAVGEPESRSEQG